MYAELHGGKGVKNKAKNKVKNTLFLIGIKLEETYTKAIKKSKQNIWVSNKEKDFTAKKTKRK